MNLLNWGVSMTLRFPKRCKHCCEKFTPEELARRLRLHISCIDGYADAQQAKKERADAKAARMAAKVERASIKARKEAIKTIPDLIKEAQREFNAYIRARDADQPCICCGQPLGAGEVGGAFDCGHYRSTGSASHLRFDERNAHAQRKVCNRWGAGRAVDYRIGLVARIGLEAVEALESNNTPHKWQREELIQIRDTYRAKFKALKSYSKPEGQT